jgi:SAM-dependent methyltransferase
MNDSSAQQDSFIYDEVPYPAIVFPQTNPERLATVGRFFGMRTADPRKCRLLELGCGSGSNLLSMAHLFPESEFVGVDLSRVQIEDATNAMQDLHLQNISFIHADITCLIPKQLGSFDYIITHGLYSWVPEAVRKSILEIFSQCLSENGVGYISYNVYPGCYFRQMMWEAMRYHVSGIPLSPDKIIKEAKSFVSELADSAKADSPFGSILKEELQQLDNRPDSNIFHDELGEINQPFYFHEFMSKVGEHGFKFLAEASPEWLYTVNFDPQVQVRLRALEVNREKREQYIDFIRCTRFRNTLLCRKEVELLNEPTVESFKEFFIACPLKPESEKVDISESTPETFILPDGTELSVNQPLTKAVFVLLYSKWPHPARFGSLLDEIWETLDDVDRMLFPEELKMTVRYLIELFKAGILTLCSVPPSFTSVVSEYPSVTSFTRWQVKTESKQLVTLIGGLVDRRRKLFQYLIPLLDGTRNHATLIKEIKEIAKSIPDPDEELSGISPDSLNADLQALADLALLIR